MRAQTMDARRASLAALAALLLRPAAGRVTAGELEPVGDGDSAGDSAGGGDAAEGGDPIPEEAAWGPRIAVSILMGLLVVVVVIGLGGRWVAVRRRRARARQTDGAVLEGRREGESREADARSGDSAVGGGGRLGHDDALR